MFKQYVIDMLSQTPSTVSNVWILDGDGTNNSVSFVLRPIDALFETLRT